MFPGPFVYLWIQKSLNTITANTSKVSLTELNIAHFSNNIIWMHSFALFYIDEKLYHRITATNIPSITKEIKNYTLGNWYLKWTYNTPRVARIITIRLIMYIRRWYVLEAYEQSIIEELVHRFAMTKRIP